MYKTQKEYDQINEVIKIFKWFLIGLLLIVAFTELSTYPFCWSILCISSFFSHIAVITKNAIPLLAALLATFVADRHISYTKLNKEFDEVGEIVQNLTHYINIAEDLKNKVGYLKKMTVEGDCYSTTLANYADSIEKRYESLFDIGTYKYIHGDTAKKIGDMSPHILSIVCFISVIKLASDIKPNIKLPPQENYRDKFDKLTNTIDSFLGDLQILSESYKKKFYDN